MIQRVAIISTGDELVTGKIVDTNSSYIADRLNSIGVEVVAVLTVGDVPQRLEWAWRTAIELADVVISTGGIGPTVDDLTTETVAAVTGRSLFKSEEAEARMREIFAAVGRRMPENNLKQALFPVGATIIRNPIGTAPGFRLEISRDGRPVHLIVLPGVPREMKPMLEESVLPWVQANRGRDTVFVSRVFQTFGITESGLDEALAGVISPGEARISFRASFPEISVKISLEDLPARAEERIEELSRRVLERIGEFVYGLGDTTMEAVVGELLAKNKLTLAVAESCTGGLIGHRLTNVPGSSRYVLGDFVTYSNQSKVKVLGVNPETLEKYGAVSEECALEMATGARDLTRADLGISTTGIAGPDGGTPEKPVGTVWLGFVAEGVRVARRYRLRGDRRWIKQLAAQIALDWVRRYALGLPLAESNVFRR